ncbi:30S ribosomal protein S15 [Candidatus Sneabacter namystus]|uniref:Small ribosomal subunit protein uS15 n=1 Tax=Candidatus Sneabacter namystus TaxID=2601646 RepID=A0A5C0UI75_9RICK|nr:30S ribosomal protein S15 [Candidatus Sneabacter namystus]QEK39808.1 30S ribosomal protein S15 [Candidatus Sneabacter namystus]
MISSDQVRQIIKDFGTSAVDSGSSEVQCALLTYRIKGLSDYVKTYKKDFSAKRLLLKLVSKRKRLLAYLKSVSINRYAALIEKLGLRK